jgi:feruloyl-CoA synthase
VTAGEPSKDLRKELRSALNRLAGEGAGSTQRIDRLLILTEPPSLDAGEITDKGYVNQAAARERRADMIARLYVDPPPAGVVALSEMSPEKPQGAEQAG